MIYLLKLSYFLPREFNGLYGAEDYIFSNTFHCVSRPDLNVWGLLSHIITGEQLDFLDYFGSNCNNGYISFDVFFPDSLFLSWHFAHPVNLIMGKKQQFVSEQFNFNL